MFNLPIGVNFVNMFGMSQNTCIQCLFCINFICLFTTQGNPISGYRRLRDFGGKQMMSSSDSVCTYPLLMIKKVLLEDKQRNLYFLS